MSTSSIDLEKTKKFCELLAVGVGVLIFMCPVLGYITKQVYFAKRGMENVSTAHLEYVTAGALVEFFILIPLFIYLILGVLTYALWSNFKEMFPIFFFSWETGESTHELPRFVKYVGRSFLAVMFFGVVGGAIFILYALYSSGLENDWHKVRLMGAAAGGAFLLLVYLILAAGEYSGIRMAYAAGVLIISFTFSVGHAAVFGHTVYEEVPRFLGGGKPSDVHLSLRDDPQTLKFAQGEGLVVSEGSLKVENVRLIAEAQDGYFVLVDDLFGDGRVLFLGRSLVHNTQNASALP